ncbi:uncharacterized protein VTP21DRAFT_2762 [Calcarisporiella thermophila]|uniref:uncharacterized protein n=1 Tax=Calcarisporiella thermophila TaxID=911321 RepID=UPI003743BC03
MTSDIATLSKEFQEIRNSNSQQNIERKKTVLKELKDVLGIPGTPAYKVIQNLGEPDELTHELGDISASLMPGPVLKGGRQADSEQDSGSYYLNYHATNKMDSLWFKVNAASEKIEGSGFRSVNI